MISSPRYSSYPNMHTFSMGKEMDLVRLAKAARLISCTNHCQIIAPYGLFEPKLTKVNKNRSKQGIAKFSLHEILLTFISRCLKNLQPDSVFKEKNLLLQRNPSFGKDLVYRS